MKTVEILNHIKEKFPGETSIIECGLHSEIPHCCILHMLSLEEEPNASMLRFLEKERGFNFGYRPCPTCMIKGNPVPLKACNCWGNKDIDFVTNDYWYCMGGLIMKNICANLVVQKGSICNECLSKGINDILIAKKLKTNEIQ